MLAYVRAWPLAVHLFSGTFCMSCSAIYHLFYIKSPHMFDLCLRFDYAGICILIMGSSWPPIIYMFTCKEVFMARNVFLGLITTTSLTSFVMLMTPEFNKPKWRTLRGVTFIILGLSAGLPFFYIFSADKKYFVPSYDYRPWLAGGALYIGGAIIYILRFPEKYFPKKFDLCMSSHNIFHIMVLIAFAVQFQDSLKLYFAAGDYVCPIEIPAQE